MSSHLRPFVLLQVANFLGSTSNAMAFIAIPWLVIELTGSATQTGIVAAVTSLPGVIIAPLAGILIDRWGRRRVSILSDVLSALSLALFPLAAWTLGLSLQLIIALGVLGAIFDPAGYTARKTLIQPVARATGIALEKANSVHQALFGAGFVVGPGVAALLIAQWGAVTTFWIIAALPLVAAIAILVMPQVLERAESDTVESHWLSDAVDGFRFIWRDKALLVLTLFFVVVDSVYLPSEVVILPTYFEEIDNPAGLGVVLSALAGGVVVGSYLYSNLARRWTSRQIFTVSVLGASTALFGLAFLPPLWLMVVSGFFVGLLWGPMGPLINTLVQRRSPEHLHGRVFGAQTALFSLAPPLGMVVSGALVDSLGVVTFYPILIGAVWALGVAVVMLPVLSQLNGPETGSDRGD